MKNATLAIVTKAENRLLQQNYGNATGAIRARASNSGCSLELARRILILEIVNRICGASAMLDLPPELDRDDAESQGEMA